MHSPRLLLSAAVTVTLPGLLAVFAVVGHEHSAAQASHAAATAAATAALSEAMVSGPLPVAPARTRTAVRNAVAAVQGTSGARITVLGGLGLYSQEVGMRLLAKAAAAGQITSYQGTELSSESSVAGSVTMVSSVSHSAGGLTLVQATTSTGSTVSYAADDRSPEGVFGVTTALIAQLGKHYVAVYQGSGQCDGRAAAIVTVYRVDGSLAARFWLDKQTGLPLRRQLFDTSDRLVGEESFLTVRFGPQSAQSAAALASAKQAESAWVTASSPASVLAALSGKGLQLPDVLPGGLPLYAAAWRGTGASEVIDLEYSDGLYVVSLFLQQGTLAATMPGWHEMRLSGRQVYVDGQSVAWASSGVVYTLIANTPPQTVSQALTVLPQASAPGFLARFGRGLDRLAHLVNPFG